MPSVASNISALPLPLPVPSRPDPVPAADGPDDFTNLLDSVSASDAPPVPQGPPARASSLPPPEDPAPPRAADPHANAPGSTDSPADAQGPSDPRNPSDSQGAANASDPEESRDAPKPVDVHGRDLPGTKTKGATNASPRALAVLTALAARLGIHPAPLAAAGQDPVATPGDPQPGAGSDGPAPAKDDKPGKTEEAPVIDASAGPVDPTLTLTAQPTIAPAAVAAVPADPTTTTPAPAPSGTAPINAIADAADVKTAAPVLAPATLAAVAGPAAKLSAAQTGAADAPTDAHAPTDAAAVPADADAPAVAPAVPQGAGITVASEDKAKAAPSTSPASPPPTTPSLNASVARAETDAPANMAAATRPEPGDAPAHGHAESAPDLARPPAVGGGIQASTDIQPSLTPVAPAAAQPFSAVLALTPQHPAAASDRAVPLAGVAIEIAARVEDGQKRFEIRLDPPELGRIEVRLDVDAAGRVATHLMADRTDTLDLLRRDAPALERALQSAGLKTDDGTLQFSLRDQSFAGRDPGFARIAPPAQLIVPDADGAPLDAALRRYGQLMGLGGGVDIRV